MSTELMIPDAQLLEMMEIDADTYFSLKSSLYPGANDEAIQMVVAYCRAAKLDLIQKPVHIVPMWNDKLRKMIDVIMPGISMYRTFAARSNEYVGKSEPEFGPTVTEVIGSKSVTYPTWCKITVKRLIQGNVCEFTAKEMWRENYASTKDGSPNSMWSKRSYAQLAKCTEAQALRMAFPEHVGSQPTFEEMDGKTLEGTCETVTTQAISQTIITQEMAEALIKRADETNSNVVDICKHCNIASLLEMTESQWVEICRMLDKKLKKQAKTDSLQINQLFDAPVDAEVAA